jgi:FKBP-type peptidyl-prolyl cis-trans isomerase (trigger factor)
MNDHAYTWFEQEWHTRITQVKVQTKHKFDASVYLKQPQCSDYSDLVQLEHVPIMKVEIEEPDLEAMIRQLRESHAHTEVQKRYPHLKEAYMSYLSQVYLTVDKWPS